MNIITTIQEGVSEAVKALYGLDITPENITLNVTRSEFAGDYTVVVFPFTKAAKKAPPVIAEEIGAFLADKITPVSGYNVVKGFLNIEISKDYWMSFLQGMYNVEQYGYHPSTGKKVLVEFSSPNTNKPLHLGHIRNILLGWSTYKILTAAGNDVSRIQIVNDRGIAICKSMLAWKKLGKGVTPASSGKKGDHLVGDFYVAFEQLFQAEYKAWQSSPEGKEVFASQAKKTHSEEVFFKDYKDDYFNQYSKVGAEARKMLKDWEDGDEEVLALWKMMNDWVYTGFDVTYEDLGVKFDKLYFESNTYLEAKEMVQKGLDMGVFTTRADGSVIADMEDVNLGVKTILRGDGTSLYLTQDLGTARKRYEDFKADQMIYVVANEQNDHFKKLFEILKRLEEPYADGLFHLSYGMINLTTGKMKSREGTIVDADDLMKKVINEATSNSKERATTAELSHEEQADIFRKIGLAALKFFIVKVNPKKTMTFDPRESVDLQGQTGPYVQNAYVRIQSILKKADMQAFPKVSAYKDMAVAEKDLITTLYQFPGLIQSAAEGMDPSLIANYCYNLAKAYHKFYHDYSILKAESEPAKEFRLILSIAIANVLKTGMDLLGIEMPDRM